ncbi:arylsulfatase [Leadbettera azotonutricia ZAS-9]|uniref:Arylsulfatase n=2 Tax=Leadbettera azotonutricia TaxID=150829 RepID=F5Y958_LEAAZ|nr:arylsulfatase [Leadbettera azotonutricia ZAS-9]
MAGQYRNLLFLLADQLRHDAPGYALGGKGLSKTPHIDRLASRGIAYSRAYTPLPVCAPARQSLLCGRHPDSFGAFWNHGFFNTPDFVPPSTLTQNLAACGKRGYFAGKWDIAKGTKPQDFGFSAYCSKSEYALYYKDRYPALNFEGGWMGCESPVKLEDADTHFFARKAVDFIREKPSPNENGFFLWVDFGVPHLPCRPSAPFSAMYSAKDFPPWQGFGDPKENKPYCHKQQTLNWNLDKASWEEMAAQVARYCGVVSQLDDAIGFIVKALEESGHLDDTLIILTSDHGDMCGNHRMFDKHNTMYDDIVRVPLVISGSSFTPHSSEALVSNCLDLPLTISSLMGLPALSGAHGFCLPLKGESTRNFITSSSNGQQFGFFNTRMITDGRYKYVWNLTDVDEFYDAQTDPGECCNLIYDSSMAEYIKKFRRELFNDLKAHGDPFASEWLAPQLLEGRKL